MPATPSFFAQGTGFNGASNTSGVVLFPANILTNDLAILVMNATGTSPTMTLTSTYTFSAWVPASQIGFTNIKAYKHVCDGTESSRTVSVSFVATSLRNAAQIYVYRSPDAGVVWKHDINGASTDDYLLVAQTTVDATKKCASVSTSGQNRLLINIFIFGQRQLSDRTITGTTAWTMDVRYDGGATPSYMEASASLTTSGSVSNGVFTIQTGCQAVTIATGLWCSVASVATLSFTTAGFASASSFGILPIICPLGFNSATLTAHDMFVFDTYWSPPPLPVGTHYV